MTFRDGLNKYFVVNGGDERYNSYELTLLIDDSSKLPTDIQVGSSAKYTNPTNGDFKVFMLTSSDGTLDNVDWKQI